MEQHLAERQDSADWGKLAAVLRAVLHGDHGASLPDDLDQIDTAITRRALAALMLPGAQDLHLGGVDDPDEEPGISGGVVGKVPVHMGKVPDSRQIFGGDC